MDVLFTAQTLSSYAKVWTKIDRSEDLLEDELSIAGAIKLHPEFDRFWTAGETALHPQEIDNYVVNPLIHTNLHVIIEKQIADQSPPEVELALTTLLKRDVSRHEAIHQIIGIWGDLYFKSIRGGGTLYDWEYIILLEKIITA